MHQGRAGRDGLGDDRRGADRARAVAGDAHVGAPEQPSQLGLPRWRIDVHDHGPVRGAGGNLVGVAVDRSVSERLARVGLRAGGMGEHERATLAAMLRYYADRGLVGNANALGWLLGRAPNDLAGFLGRVAAEPDV